MSDADSSPIRSTDPKNPYGYHSNISREIALIDFLNDGPTQPGNVRVGSRDGATAYDKEDMYRMGKKQEFKRNYRPLSALSFSIVLTATWEYLMIACSLGLVHGGLAGMFWSYIWTLVGFIFVEMSLAEMASMAPTSGGQYHWVSALAPPQYQQFLSYVVGWMSTLSWQAGHAADCFITGTLAQALIVVNKPGYQPQRWEGTLFVIAMILIVYVCNIWGHDVWPRLQNGLMVLHVLAFIAVVVTLWCLAPHRTARDVFTSFTNNGDWNSLGLSMMIGQISAIYCVLGSDATAHMAEEVRDASRYIPVSLFYSYLISSLLAIVLLISFLFAIDDVAAATTQPYGYPFLYVFSHVLDPAGVNGLSAIILVLLSAANVNLGASTARQTFAFARDRGLPFSSWIAHVDREKEIPDNAVLLTSIVASLLALINIGSTTAFLAIVSLQIVSLMFTYAVSLSCVLWRRMSQPESLPHARWSLGRWGVYVNAAGLAYVLFAFFWGFWPTRERVEAGNFNWAIVLFAAVLGLCLLMFSLQGRRAYKGPVEVVRRLSGSTM